MNSRQYKSAVIQLTHRKNHFSSTRLTNSTDNINTINLNRTCSPIITIMSNRRTSFSAAASSSSTNSRHSQQIFESDQEEVEPLTLPVSNADTLVIRRKSQKQKSSETSESNKDSKSRWVKNIKHLGPPSLEALKRYKRRKNSKKPKQ